MFVAAFTKGAAGCDARCFKRGACQTHLCEINLGRRRVWFCPPICITCWALGLSLSPGRHFDWQASKRLMPMIWLEWLGCNVSPAARDNGRLGLHHHRTHALTRCFLCGSAACFGLGQAKGADPVVVASSLSCQLLGLGSRARSRFDLLFARSYIEVASVESECHWRAWQPLLQRIS